MSAWADLAGDDSNLSMAADEFVGLSVLNDISNSVSQNRSRFDPELDSSKQGLNKQLKMFGLGTNSNSGLGKKRQRIDTQPTEDDDADMPPKSKQRTGPNDFSRFLEPTISSAPDLSSLSSSSTNASGTTGSFGCDSTPRSIDNNKKNGQGQSGSWYSAVIGKGKGKRTPRSASSSHVPGLVSNVTSKTTTADPSPKSNSKTVKLAGSVPSSVRRRRMRAMCRKKKRSVKSPSKSATEPSDDGGDPDEDKGVQPMEQDENEPPQSPEPANGPQPMPMDEDGDDTREAIAQGMQVFKTEGNGRIHVPRDILESAKKTSNLPRPSPFFLNRAKSNTSGSMSPTKLSFTEENSPQRSVVSAPSPVEVAPFNMFNFMPLPIPASSFGLTTSTSVSTSETPTKEQPGARDGEPSTAQQQPLMNTAMPFIPFVPPFAMDLNTAAQVGTDGATTQANPVVFNFVPMPMVMPQLPLPTTQFSASPTATFVPFSPFAMTPSTTSFPSNPPSTTTPTAPTAPLTPTTNVDEDESKTRILEDDEDVECADAVIPVAPNSVWAAPPPEDSNDGTWAKKCFKREVARNKILKREEDRRKVEQRKMEMRFKLREKELLPIEHKPPVKVGHSGSYGSDKKTQRRWTREYHPYESRDDGATGGPPSFGFDRRMRGRARTRSLSQGIESPKQAPPAIKIPSESTSESGTNVTSPSRGKSVSASIEDRDLPKQDPEPLTAEKIAWRKKQIEMAKNTPGYQNYVAQLPKSQRRKKHPSTPNPKENISKRRWVGKFNRWRKQLHEYDVLPVQENMKVESEEPQETAETAKSSPSPDVVDVDVPSTPMEEENPNEEGK